MNSTKIYNNLIEKVKKENRLKNNIIYYEKHHIIPKCMGGHNGEQNLVLLTYKEHILSHWLLSKIYPLNHKLACAFRNMSTKCPRDKRDHTCLNVNITKAIKKAHISISNKPIICLENKKIFNSINEAGKYYNTTLGNISSCLRGKSKTAVNYHWMFLNEYNNLDRDPDISYYRNKSVICIETKEIFKSIGEASRMKNINRFNLSSCCHKHKRGTINGYHWMFLNEFNSLEEPFKPIERNEDKRKRIINLDTGEIFSSITEASKCYKLKSISSISKVCSGKLETSGGYKWAFINEEGIINMTNYTSKTKKKIINLDTGVVFNSIVEAANKYNIKTCSNISSVCKNVRKKSGGYRWSYYT